VSIFVLVLVCEGVFESVRGVCVLLELCVMENGDTTETGLSDSYLAQSYAAMEGKYCTAALSSRSTFKDFTCVFT